MWKNNIVSKNSGKIINTNLYLKSDFKIMGEVEVMQSIKGMITWR